MISYVLRKTVKPEVEEARRQSVIEQNTVYLSSKPDYFIALEGEADSTWVHGFPTTEAARRAFEHTMEFLNDQQIENIWDWDLVAVDINELVVERLNV